MLTTELAGRSARTALVQRSAADCSDEVLGSTSKAVLLVHPRARVQRSDEQRSRLITCFWMYRKELERWEETRELKVHEARDDSPRRAEWWPSMPKPPYELFANSSEFGIYLPVESVKSFFKEYKKDIREQERRGAWPAGKVRDNRLTRPSKFCVRPSSTPFLLESRLQLRVCDWIVPPESEWQQHQMKQRQQQPPLPSPPIMSSGMDPCRLSWSSVLPPKPLLSLGLSPPPPPPLPPPSPSSSAADALPFISTLSSPPPWVAPPAPPQPQQRPERTRSADGELRPPGSCVHILPPLDDADLEEASGALDCAARSRPEQVLYTVGNVPIIAKSLMRLRQRTEVAEDEDVWLDDEILNAVVHLFNSREAEWQEKRAAVDALLAIFGTMDSSAGSPGLARPRCLFLGTNFYERLSGYVPATDQLAEQHECAFCYESVSRWTRDRSPFSYDLVLVPIHKNKHWTLAVVNLKQQRFEYYDPLGGSASKVFEFLVAWLEMQAAEKGNLAAARASAWARVQFKPGSPGYLAHQLNGFDCGVFFVATADYLARDAVLDFRQQDMPRFRRSTVLALKRQRLE